MLGEVLDFELPDIAGLVDRDAFLLQRIIERDEALAVEGVGAEEQDQSRPDAPSRPAPKAQPKARAAKAETPPPASEDAPADGDADDKQSAQVVSLDAFRKKP